VHCKLELNKQILKTAVESQKHSKTNINIKLKTRYMAILHSNKYFYFFLRCWSLLLHSRSFHMVTTLIGKNCFRIF